MGKITSFEDFALMMSSGGAPTAEAISAMAKATITGSCLCGNVKYSLVGCPINRVLCHCKNCRKSSGSAFGANSFFAESQFTITQGKDGLSTYEDTNTDSGNTVERTFCQNCGSPLFGMNKDNPMTKGVVIVTTGTMDVDHQSYEDAWRPDLEVYCASREKWLPAFEGTIKG